jgi:hypothetical protein
LKKNVGNISDIIKYNNIKSTIIPEETQLSADYFSIIFELYLTYSLEHNQIMHTILIII